MESSEAIAIFAGYQKKITTNMELSSYMVFARRIAGTGWTNRAVRRKFLKEVDLADYDPSNRGELLNHLFGLAAKV